MSEKLSESKLPFNNADDNLVWLIGTYENLEAKIEQLEKQSLELYDAGVKTEEAGQILEEQLKEWDEERVPRLYLVGELIRNDWSGTEFDGRDVRDWIDLILGGIYEEFDNEVKIIAEDSILYQEIMERKEKKEK